MAARHTRIGLELTNTDDRASLSRERKREGANTVVIIAPLYTSTFLSSQSEEQPRPDLIKILIP